MGCEGAEVRKNRPTLTINRIPQFIRQVTGDMRQMRPSIKTVPVDSRGDKDTAETIAGMIRYIENRSDAAAIYMTGAESQVTCGIGHWMVKERNTRTARPSIRNSALSALTIRWRWLAIPTPSCR
jgi:hypothetical protein